MSLNKINKKDYDKSKKKTGRKKAQGRNPRRKMSNRKNKSQRGQKKHPKISSPSRKWAGAIYSLLQPPKNPSRIHKRRSNMQRKRLHILQKNLSQ